LPGTFYDLQPILENVGEFSDAIKIVIHRFSIVVVVRSFSGAFYGPQTTAYMIFNRDEPFTLKR